MPEVRAASTTTACAKKLDDRSRRAAPLFARRNQADFEAVASWFATLTDADARALTRMLGRVLDGISDL